MGVQLPVLVYKSRVRNMCAYSTEVTASKKTYYTPKDSSIIGSGITAFFFFSFLIFRRLLARPSRFYHT